MPWNEWFECGTCGKAFPAGWQARDNHLDSTGHRAPDFECERCERWFHNRSACDEHMAATNHWPYTCSKDDCCESWPTEEQRNEHEKEHEKEHEIEHKMEYEMQHEIEQRCCRNCNRIFESPNHLKSHLNSCHRVKQIACPCCGIRFTTATVVVHHLENGSCKSAQSLNRDEIYRFVRSKDPQGVISKNLIGWSAGESNYTYEAGADSWNGAAYECYFCHRGFGQLDSLNQHLNSGVHLQALYHCPNLACRGEFKTLAAVINHLESESCGHTRFKKVQRQVGDLLSGNRQIAL